MTELVVGLDTFPSDALPDYPPYSDAKPFAKFIIPPNGEHCGRAKTILNPTQKKEVWDGKLYLVFFGRVKYHMGDNEYLTRFCSYWRWEGTTLDRHRVFEPVGPPDWVEYT